MELDKPKDVLNFDIVTVDDAKKWIDNIIQLGLDFHFDDDVNDVEFYSRHVDQKLRDLLSSKRDDLYSPDFDWGKFGCPIGYLIERLER